jgi:hypothetical protein
MRRRSRGKIGETTARGKYTNQRNVAQGKELQVSDE